MKKGVKIAIIIGIILVIIIIATAVAVYIIKNNVEQNEKLSNEISKIDKIINSEDISIEKLKEEVNNLVTTGDYSKVEKAVKNYIVELYNEIYNIKVLLEDETITNVLTIDNLKNDGADLIKTKEYIQTTKQNIENSKNNIFEYLKEEKINSYIKEQNVNSFFEDIYINLITEKVKKLDDEKDELEEAVNTIVNVLNKEEEVINFLVEHKEEWKIQGQQIIFNTEEQLKNYEELVNKIKQ